MHEPPRPGGRILLQDARPPQGSGRASAAGVNLRSAPAETASVVEVLARETPLYPERSLAEWTLVRTPDGRVGWVHRKLLN